MGRMRWKYRPQFRPPGFATLPQGIAWDYFEVPRYQAEVAQRRGLPLSQWPHGMIIVDRELTLDELTTFQLIYMGEVGQPEPSTEESRR